MPFNTIGYNDTKKLLTAGLKANAVVMISGKPGEGKSALVAEVADELNLHLIDHRISTSEPVDMNGIVYPNPKTKRMDILPPQLFPLDDDPIPEGKAGFALFFDEFLNGCPETQSAAYKVLHDRMVGQRKLHPRTRIILGSNTEEDNAGIYQMRAPLQSRRVQLYMEVTSEEWVNNVAIPNKYDHRIIDFLAFSPTMKNNFDPDADDCNYACSRSWSTLNSLLKANPDETIESLDMLLEGTIGSRAFTEFQTFCEYYKDLPSLETIYKFPNGEYLLTSQQLHALIGTLIHHMKPDNVDATLAFVKRLGKEYQMRVAVQTSPIADKLGANYMEWLLSLGGDLVKIKEKFS